MNNVVTTSMNLMGSMTKTQKLKIITASAALFAGGIIVGTLVGQSEPGQQQSSEVAAFSSAQADLHWHVVPDDSKAATTPGSNTITELDVNATIASIVAQSTQFLQFAAAYPVAIRANEQQLQQLIETLLSLEQSDPDSIGIARVFYIRYINLNADAAIKHFWANMPETSPQYRRVMFNIYHEWAWVDMAGALVDITDNVQAKHQEDLIAFLLRDDHFTSNEALAELAANFSERTRAEAMLANASRQSNEVAFDQLMNLPRNSEARRHGLYRLVRRWAQEDPQAVLTRLKQMGSSSDRQNLITNVITIWSQESPEQALLAALNIADGNNYTYAALSSLAKQDGVKAMELAGQYMDKLDNTILNQIMQTWASADPHAAAGYIEQQGGAQMAQKARQIAWHYTLQYPQEAYRWAERVGLTGDRNLASHMGNALVQADLSKAEEIFAELPPSASRDGLFANIVRQRSKIDIAQTYKWLGEYAAEPKYSEARNNLMYEWSRRDPQSASEVILNMEDNPNRTGHLSSVANNWYERSPEQALRWIYGLPTGALRDRTIASLVHKIRQVDIEQATTIASEVSDEQFRQNLLEQLSNQKP